MNLATLRTWLPDRWLNQLTLAPTDLLRDATYRRLWTSILISSFGGQVTLLALPLTAAVLMHAAEGHPRILRYPAPVSRLMQFSDHGMDLELRFWIADPEAGVNNVRSDVNRAIWRLFRDAGITIPVAQREVYLRHNDLLH